MNPEEGNTPSEWQGKRPYNEFMAWARGEEDEQGRLVTMNELQFESLDPWTLRQKNGRLQEEVMRLINCVVQEKERAMDMQIELETQNAITAQLMDTAFQSNTFADRLITENQRLNKEEAQLVAAKIKLSQEVEALKVSNDELTMEMNATRAKHVVDESTRAEDVRDKAMDSNTAVISPPRKAITNRTTENERLSSENGALKKQLIAHKKRAAQAVAENKMLSREIEMHKRDKIALGRELHAQVVNECREAQVLSKSERLPRGMKETFNVGNAQVEHENRTAQVNNTESPAAQIRINSLSDEVERLMLDKDVLTRKLNAKVAYENRAAQAVAENQRLSRDIEALTIENAMYRSSQAYPNLGYDAIVAPFIAENQRLSFENEALKYRSTEMMMQLHAKVGEERKR